MIPKTSSLLHRIPRCPGFGLLSLLGLAALCLSSTPAAADFRLCNNTSSRVGIALGYKDAEGWTTEGWWNVSSRSCETLLKGTLVARYYYIYALDYDRGGEWSGQAFMCSRDKEFTIKGTENCLARGFDRTCYLLIEHRIALFGGLDLRGREILFQRWNLAVVDLRGQCEVAVALGDFGLAAQVIEFFLDVLDIVDGLLLVGPAGLELAELLALVRELALQGG